MTRPESSVPETRPAASGHEVPTPWSGRVAIITGASSGIGRSIALAMAQRGARVCLVGRDHDRLAEVAARARAFGREGLIRPADLASEDEVERLGRELASELEALDVLVHCAGILHVGPAPVSPAAELDLLYRVNARAPYHLTEALLPLLRQSRGHVVFLNTSAGLRAGADNGPYAATKHALRALADSLRERVNADGVRVLNVYPGRVATPMQRELYAREGRPYDPTLLLQPEDVAEMVVAALSLPAGAEVTEISMRPTRKSY